MSDPALGGAISFEIGGVQYVTTLLPAVDGIRILSKLVALLGEPIAGLFEVVAKDPTKLAKVLAAARTPGDTTKIEDLLGGVSLSSLGRDLRAGLSTVDAVPLILEIVQTSHRNGKALRDPTEFNLAFRGNYGEMFRLVFELIKVNRLFPLPGI